jgi:alkaline phosphatase
MMSSCRVSRPLVLCLALLVSALALSPLAAQPEADSVILLIGDGMGPGQVEMAAGAQGAPLAMQRMPYSGLVTTTSLGGKITDSAAAGTALATGHKTENGKIAMSPEGQVYRTILEVCRDQGKSVGIITTDALWGATPACFAAHASSRGLYDEIALQMTKSRARVMMGYGESELLPASADGKRKDEQNLIRALARSGYEIARNREQLVKAKSTNLVGLFEDGPETPTLTEAVQAALLRLSANRKGLFLMVEGARVDWASHGSDPAGTLLEMRNLDGAVAAAVDFARRRGRTLVVVTADHETGGLVINDPNKLRVLAPVKADADAIAGALNDDRSNVAEVMAEYTGIKDLTPEETESIKTAKEAAGAISAVLSARAGLEWTGGGGHTATPVRVFAFGPGASRFAGTMDNTEIPEKIGAATRMVIPAK